MANYSEKKDPNVELKTFSLPIKIQIDAKTPHEADKIMDDWLMNPNDNWQYYVHNENTKLILIIKRK